MDEYDRETAIRNYIREYLSGFSLSHNRQLSTDEAIDRVEKAFSTLTRGEKGEIRKQLDRDQLRRRDFLKLLGISAGTAATIGFLPTLRNEIGSRTSPTGYASACDYETITLRPGEEREDRIGNGETFENVLIDQTAEGASFKIIATAGSWVIRNVGFKGVGQYQGDHFQMRVGGNGLIENVFIDNRTPAGVSGKTNIGGALVARQHSGTLEVRNTFIAGCGNNAFYASNAAKDGGGGGATKFYNCYHRDNTVSQYRIGGEGSLVKNCVGVVNDPEGRRGLYPRTTSRRARGIWARHTPDLHAENTVMYISPDDDDPWANYMVHCFGRSDGNRTVLNVKNARYNADAPQPTDIKSEGCPASINGELETGDLTLSVIADGGVPTSPEEAACGQRGTPPAPEEVSGTVSGSTPKSGATNNPC